MALRNLHGYWKYSDAVVPFRIQPIEREQVAHAFVRRSVRSVVEQPHEPPPQLVEPEAQEQRMPEIISEEIATEVKSRIDWDF